MTTTTSSNARGLHGRRYGVSASDTGYTPVTTSSFEWVASLVARNIITTTSTFILNAQPSPVDDSEDSAATSQPPQPPAAIATTPIPSITPTARNTQTSLSSKPALSTSATSPVLSSDTSGSHRPSPSVSSSRASSSGAQSRLATSTKPSGTSPTTTSINVSGGSVIGTESPIVMSSPVNPSKQPPIGVVVGGILGGLALIASLILFASWLYAVKRKGSGSPSMRSPSPVFGTGGTAFGPTSSDMTLSTAHVGGWATGYGLGPHGKGTRHRTDMHSTFHGSEGGLPSDPSSSRSRLVIPSPSPPMHRAESTTSNPVADIRPNPAASSSSNRNFDTPPSRRSSPVLRRELDGGPAPQHLINNSNGEGGRDALLPPEYDQLFVDPVSDLQTPLPRTSSSQTRALSPLAAARNTGGSPLQDMRSTTGTHVFRPVRRS